ncbi:SMI1/KNR4 family protein [Lacticaseibacillus brantae]|uniref:Knr4/Smi1-like domain-containing protein n=1 Tax=Lacticaseibacillus brantae DSM 23927 TaxID=1423727 RepID=A0A0R2AWS0_9LACO|nr:SMI1/KNR4 family protein [Lacticaseibacillus brantae]KRM71253.1 hypothetical protein FC34_GL001731 [Lacticaseibacillus brantae DSM 23927]
MHDWPIPPVPTLLTIPKLPAIPDSYWAIVQTGQFPERFWLTTPEPTSDSLDGVTIHGFARAGAAVAIPGLPAHLVPFAQDGQQYFVFDVSTTPAAIRYIDTDVDQWLDIASDFDHFWQSLTRIAPTLTESTYSRQKLGHALLVAHGTELSPLLELARFKWPWQEYGDWLLWLLANRPAAIQRVILDEFIFLHDFMPRHLSGKQMTAIASGLDTSEVSSDFHFKTEKW